MTNGLILRKNVEALPDAEIETLRNAYSTMMQFGDNRGYNYYAGLHGIPGLYCWHHHRSLRGQVANLFLPWHRAYILYFEQAVRDQNVDAVLPWWDWTSDSSRRTGAPEAFSADTVAGLPNPLFAAHVNVPTANPPLARDTRRFLGNPNQLPTSTQVDALYDLSDFEDFSDQLEDIHDAIHGWTGGFSAVNGQLVGGDMGTVATAAWDPIFWSHHCMIDRIWYLWQLRNGPRNIPSNYLGMALAPFHVTVADVLDIHQLGYEYAQSEIIIK